MKKTLISLAIATGMVASGAAMAEGEPTVYGIVHVSINQFDTTNASGTAVNANEDKMYMSSNTTAIGVKGSEDLGDGMKALYKLEFQVNVAGNGGGLADRDQWVGLKGGMGTVKFGTMSSNYKQMGGKVDPFYRTLAEGRGVLNMQSPYLHGGQGDDRGRMNRAVQYSSPKMGGMQMVLNVGMSGAGAGGGPDDETIGVGFRYETKDLMAYFDYIEPGYQGANAESAMKFGAKYDAGSFSVAAQMEMTEDFYAGPAGGFGDFMFIAGTFKIDGNNSVSATFGNQDKISDSFAIGYTHKMSKQTDVYALYGDISEDTPGTCVALSVAGAGNACRDDDSLMSFGIRKKF